MKIQVFTHGRKWFEEKKISCPECEEPPKYQPASVWAEGGEVSILFECQCGCVYRVFGIDEKTWKQKKELTPAIAI